MNDKAKSKEDLLKELVELQQRISELEKSENEHKEAEKSLKQEIEFTMKMLHASPSFFVTLNPDGTTLMMNETMLKALGYTTTDIVTKDYVKTFIKEQDQVSVMQTLKDLVKDKRSTLEHVHMRTKKRNELLVEWHYNPVFRDDGSIDYIFGFGIDLTARKETQKALAESEEMYRTLVETSPDAVTITDLEGKIIELSQQTLKQHGFENSEELIGKSGFELIASEDRERAITNLQKTLAKGIQKHDVYTLMKKDGTSFLGEVSAGVIKNSAGEPKAFIVTTRDITERKQMEKVLRTSEEKYRRIIEQSKDVIFAIDSDDKIIFVSPSCKEIYGYEQDDFKANPQLLQEIVHPDCRDDYSDFWRYYKEKGVFKEEIQKWCSIRKDGKKIYTENQFTNVYDDQGNIIGFQTIARDITKRIEAEDKLLKSEEKYRRFIEQSLQGLVVIQNSRIVFTNAAFAEASGYTIEELMNLSPRETQALVHPDYQKIVWGRLKDQLMGKSAPEHYEFLGVRKDGKTRWLEMFVKPIEFEGKPAVQGVIVDITERKRIQEKLEESENKYRLLVDNALVGVYKSNIKGNIIYANAALAEMFGFTSPAEMISYGVLSVYKTDEDRKKFLEDIRKKGRVSYFEIELVTKKGNPINVLISATLERDILSGMIMDITARKRIEQELKNNVEKLQQLMTNTVDSMASILETRDPYTAGHQQRVARLAIAIAKEMNLSEEQIMGLKMAATVHDIGKIYIPAEILTRPSELTESEFALIKTHPKVGYEILKKVEFPWPVAEIVLQHHERFNGSGYPQGIKEKDIIFEARILSVADVVEAMVSHRPYRAARTLETTLEEISGNKNVLYDPIVADTCLRLFKEKGFKFNND